MDKGKAVARDQEEEEASASASDAIERQIQVDKILKRAEAAKVCLSAAMLRRTIRGNANGKMIWEKNSSLALSVIDSLSLLSRLREVGKM